MLITHHRDRPGMIGRIGQTLGEADVNISAMHVGRSAPRADALMILALDDDVQPRGRRRDPGPRLGHRPVDDPAGDRALTSAEAATRRRRRRPRSPTGSTRRSSSSGTASRRSSSRVASRARPIRRSRPTASPRPASSGRGWPIPQRRPRCRSRRRRRSRSSIRRSPGPPRRPARSRAAMADPAALGAVVPVRPDPGFIEIGQGEWEGLHRSEIEARWGDVLATWRRRPLEAWAPGGEALPDVQARLRPALGRVLASLAAAGTPGTLDGPQVARLPRRAGADAARGRSSSATTASSRSCC